MIDDLYNDVMLRRWSLDMSSGRLECFDDAADIRLISEGDRAAVEAKNDELQSATATVEAYETASRVSLPEEPHEQDQLDSDGNVIGSEPTPAYQNWLDAQAIVLAVPADIVALANLRAGTASEDDVALVLSTWGNRLEIAVPTPQELARLALPDLQPWQFFAVVDLAEIGDSILAVIAAIPDPIEKTVASRRYTSSNTYSRMDPLFENVRSSIGLTPEHVDYLWGYAGALKIDA